MIYWPLIYSVILGVPFGVVIGVTIVFLRSERLRTGMGNHCPCCRKDGTMRTAAVMRMCKECGMVSTIKEIFQ